MGYTFGEYIHRNYGNQFYAKSSNLTHMLTKSYDEALKQYDVLVMPTLPTKPMCLPTAHDSVQGMLKVCLLVAHDSVQGMIFVCSTRFCSGYDVFL